jgi:4'-phosphopantetheinyl transferase
VDASDPNAGAVPPLHHGEAHVWWARRRDASPRLHALLDDIERARLSAYQRVEDQSRFVVGRALAKAAIARYVHTTPSGVRLARGCSACRGHHGKPQIVAPRDAGIELSISHSGDAIAVAVTLVTPIGIDVERLAGRPDIAKTASLALSSAELSSLSLMSADQRTRAFLIFWTRKEAITKATGLGLRLAPRNVVVTPPDDLPRVLAWDYDLPPQAVSVSDLQACRGYVAALALLGPCKSVSELDGSRLLADVTTG